MMFGVTIFYFIWEVNFVYTLSFMPVMLALNAMEISEIGEVKAGNKILGIVIPVVIAIMIPLCVGEVDQRVEKQFQNYSINYSYFRRSDLEDVVTKVIEENKEIEQKFRIQKGKNFNKIKFMVKRLSKNPDVTYKFKLFKDDSLVYETAFQINHDRYIEMQLPVLFGSGEYSFVILPYTGEYDTAEFIFASREMYDNNPYGYLSVNGEDFDQKLDLVFDVFEYYEEEI